MSTHDIDMVPRSKAVVATLVGLAAGLLVGAYLGATFMAMYSADQEIASGTTPGQSQVAPPADMPPAQAQNPAVSPEDQQNIKTLTAMVEADPDDVESWTRLGNVYFDTGQPLKAIEAYERSLALAPDNANVWTDLGVMYRRSGDPLKAVESFDRAIEVDPGHSTPRFNKGVVLLHDLNDTEGALAAWTALLEVHPDATAPDGTPVADIIRGIRGE